MSHRTTRKKTKPSTGTTAVRPTAGDHPPPIPKPFPPGAVHDSPKLNGVEAQAQKLLHDAGSPQQAKQAIDTAAHRETVSSFYEDFLAEKLGYNSRKEFLAASTPITAADGTTWWATSDPRDSKWVVWSEDEAWTESFDSLEEARRHVYTSKA